MKKDRVVKRQPLREKEANQERAMLGEENRDERENCCHL